MTTHIDGILRAARTCCAAGILSLLVVACGSDEKSTEAEEQPAVASTGERAATSDADASGQIPDPDDVSNWLEAEPTAPAPLADIPSDPDALIERYKSACSGGSKSAECRALRLAVEGVFLEALVAVRGSDQLASLDWYRLAATAETPQLACIGLNELLYAPERTAQDEAALVAALDSPYLNVRSVVIANAGRVTALSEPVRRVSGFGYRTLSGTCIDAARDPIPGVKWAGGYPGARYRPFASSDSLRWFTTPDPPDAVYAWFAEHGKPARTEAELVADAQANYLAEVNRITESPDPDDEAKLMALITGQGSEAQWSAPFRSLEGTGEIKYVMIGPQQAVAVFRDDFLDATSIVAPMPAAPVDLTPDMQELQEEAEMQSIFGY